VTGVGSTTALSVIKGLKKQNEFDVVIVGTDINERTSIAGSHFCDKFYRVPPAINETAYMHVLEAIANSESVDLLIPIVDIELEVIARNRDIIEKSTYLLLSSYDTIMTCADKFKVHEFFNNVGIPTPKTILVNDSVRVSNLITKSGMNFPLIVKPRKGLGSRDVYEIRNEEELFLVKRLKDPILQEMCLGQEYTIDVFYDGTARALISAVPRKRIETRSGISYKGETEKDAEFTEYARKIAEKLNIKGPANIQCFKAGTEVRFTEVNPRFSGSLPLTMEAGVNTPLFGLKMAAGDRLEPVEDFKSVRMCRYWEEVFYEV